MINGYHGQLRIDLNCSIHPEQKLYARVHVVDTHVKGVQAPKVLVEPCEICENELIALRKVMTTINETAHNELMKVTADLEKKNLSDG